MYEARAKTNLRMDFSRVSILRESSAAPGSWVSRCISAAKALPRNPPDWNAQPHGYRSHLLTRGRLHDHDQHLEVFLLFARTRGRELMDITINGSYLPYAYIVLLKTSLFFMQRLNHRRQRSPRRGASATANLLIDFYCALAAFIAGVLNWSTWVLAIYVGYLFGIPAGVLFFVAGFLGSMALTFVVPLEFAFDVIGHVISLPATPYLVLLTLRSLGII